MSIKSSAARYWPIIRPAFGEGDVLTIRELAKRTGQTRQKLSEIMTCLRVAGLATEDHFTQLRGTLEAHWRLTGPLP